LARRVAELTDNLTTIDTRIAAAKNEGFDTPLDIAASQFASLAAQKAGLEPAVGVLLSRDKTASAQRLQCAPHVGRSPVGHCSRKRTSASRAAPPISRVQDMLGSAFWDRAAAAELDRLLATSKS